MSGTKPRRGQPPVWKDTRGDTQAEREFAKKLDEREDIKLFVKLPA